MNLITCLVPKPHNTYSLSASHKVLDYVNKIVDFTVQSIEDMDF
jgi:hypothetical protein